jgi:phosphoglycolate phosphatase-like HAD superfamily hydrolase
MERLAIDSLIEQLAELLDREYACLLAWQPRELLEIAEKRRRWQDEFSQALGDDSGRLADNVREKLEKLRRLGWRNLALARAGLRVIESINNLLGRGAQGTTYQPRAAAAGQLEPLVERLI